MLKVILLQHKTYSFATQNLSFAFQKMMFYTLNSMLLQF